MGLHQSKPSSHPDRSRKENRHMTTSSNQDDGRREKAVLSKDSSSEVATSQEAKNVSTSTMLGGPNPKKGEQVLVNSIRPIVGTVQTKLNTNRMHDATIEIKERLNQAKAKPRTSSTELLRRWSSPSNPYVDMSKEPYCDTSSTSNTCIPEKKKSLIKVRNEDAGPVESSFRSTSAVLDSDTREDQPSADGINGHEITRTPSNPYIESYDTTSFKKVATSIVNKSLPNTSNADSVKAAQTKSFIIYSNPDAEGRTTHTNPSTSSTPSTQKWKRKKKYHCSSSDTLDKNDEMLDETEVKTPSTPDTGPLNSNTVLNPSSTSDIDSTVLPIFSTSAPGVGKWKRKKRYTSSSSVMSARRSEASDNTLFSVPSTSDISSAKVNLSANTFWKQDLDKASKADISESATAGNSRWKRKTKYTNSGVEVAGRREGSGLLPHSTPATSSTPRIANDNIRSFREIGSSEEDAILKAGVDISYDKASLKTILSSDIKEEEDIWRSPSEIAINVKVSSLEHAKKSVKTASTLDILLQHKPLLDSSRTIGIGTDEKKSSSNPSSYGDIDAIHEPYFSTSSTPDLYAAQHMGQLYSCSDSAIDMTESLHSSKSSLQGIGPKQGKPNTATLSDPDIRRKKEVTFITPSSTIFTHYKHSNKDAKKEESTSTTSLISAVGTTTQEPVLHSSSSSESENGLVLWKSPSNPYI